MRLSALEIKKKEFQQKMRGIDQEEVQAFLDRVSEEVEALTSEKRSVEDKLATTEERLSHYLSLESTLEKTLAAAQQTAVKLEEQAKKEAELILRSAEIEKDQKLMNTRLELSKVQSDLLRAESEYQSMIARMRSAMASFSTFIEALQAEAAPSSTHAADLSNLIASHE